MIQCGFTILQEPLQYTQNVVNDQYANEPLQYTDVNPQEGDMALVEPSGYALKHKYETEYGYKDEDDASMGDTVGIYRFIEPHLHERNKFRV